MTATIQAKSQNSGSGTAATGNRPTGTVDGDLLVAWVAIDLAATPAPTIAPPSGWDTVEDALFDYEFGHRLGCYARPASSEPASWNWTLSNSDQWTVEVLRIDGHDAASPINISAKTDPSVSTTTPTAPAVTTTVDDCLIIYSVGMDTDATPFTPPSGTSEEWDFSDGSGCSQSGASKAQVTAGNTGTGQFTSSAGSSEQWAAITIAIAPSAGTVVGLNTLTLASSIPSLAIATGAIGVALNTLTLAGSVPSLTVAPGAIGVALNTLTLAATVENLSVIVPGVTVSLSTLTLASSLVDLTVIRSPAYIPIPPIRFGTVVRVLLADHTGHILADARTLVGSVSWRLNSHGRATLTFARTDGQATEENLRFHNRVLIQFDNGLSDWAGVIIGRRWTESAIEVTLNSAEYILGFATTDRGRYFDQATAGHMFRSVVGEANTAWQTGIYVGQVYGGGPVHTTEYHLENIYRIVKDSICGRLSDYEFDVTPQLVGGTIRLTANLYQRRGQRKPAVWLAEGQNVAVESVDEQGPVINHWQVAGADITGATADGWGDGRLISQAIDEASVGRYGRVMDAEIYGGVEEMAELDEAGRFLVRQTARPRTAICLTAYNRPPGYFADYNLGDRVRVILPSYTFDGIDDYYRVIGREFEPESGLCGLVVERDTDE